MEITKGRNLIEFEAEIKGRPARTWFQTSAEKAVAKSQSPPSLSLSS
jgi:ATP-dependent RNA helicase DDX27